MYIVAIVGRHTGAGAGEGRVLERKAWFVLANHDGRENERENIALGTRTRARTRRAPAVWIYRIEGDAKPWTLDAAAVQARGLSCC